MMNKLNYRFREINQMQLRKTKELKTQKKNEKLWGEIIRFLNKNKRDNKGTILKEILAGNFSEFLKDTSSQM